METAAHPPAQGTAKRRSRPIIAGVMTAILAPVIGCVIFFTAVGAASALFDASYSTSRERIEALLLGPVMGATLSPFALLIFSPMTAVAGLIVGIWIHRHGAISYRACAAIGAVTTAIAMPIAYGADFGSAAATQVTVDRFSNALTSIPVMAALAAVTALVMRWLAGRIGVVRHGPPASPEAN
ncbi:MAG: hypothetical protein ACFCUN_09855 [Hyphomicrobiaceae bacterium]